ncbi:hypothetical protein ACPJXG_10885 [Janthinobacterium sp. NFX145]|uniref:hypothetical protein n=1 Tax=Janthinobacterium sp. NFX145 TaxID=3415602 RepID=UPI003CC58B32
MADNLVALNAVGEIVFQVDPDPLVVRAQIAALKDHLLSLPGLHVEMPVEHTVQDGVYTRKLFIKKGTILVGKIHRKACVNIVAMGDISVVTETGYARVRAGHVQTSPAGLQKVGYAHEDTIFINVFRTDQIDIAAIEVEIACESHDELDGALPEHKETLCQ